MPNLLNRSLLVVVRTPLLAVSVGLLCVVIFGCATSSTDGAGVVAPTMAETPTPASMMTRPAALFGILAQRRPDQTPRDALEEVDAAAGRRLDLVRVDMDWTSDFPTRDIAEMIEDGRSVYLTITPRRLDGSAVPWIAIAEQRDNVGDELERWASAIAAIPEISLVTFHPGADAAADPAFGTPEEFQQAWKAFFDAIETADPPPTKASPTEGAEKDTDAPARKQKQRRLWVPSDALLRTGEPDAWYPGDDAVDAIGTETHNNYDCSVEPLAWQTPRQMLSPLIAFGSQHQDKALVAAALGSVEDDANPVRKAEWYASIAEMLTSPELANLDTVVIHHGADPLAPRCAWWVNTSKQSTSGFADLAGDPLMNGNHAAPADVRCGEIASYQSLPSDGAATDVDRDGHADLYFGAESRVVGIGEEGADGRDQRVLLPFGPLDADPHDGQRVILRVRLGGRAPRHAVPVKLSALVGNDAISEQSFDAASKPIDLAFMNSDSLAGYYLIDVTDYVSSDHGVTFRLELEEPPALDGAGDPYPITMSEAEVQADRPTLVVRSC